MFTDDFVVDLAKHTCSCNFWDLVGYPCRHGVAAIHRKVDDPIKYVRKCYHMTIYIACYNEVITLISGQNKRLRTTDPKIWLLSFKRGPGRPKNLCRRESNEASQTRCQRISTCHMCKTCLKYRHNTRTCKKNKQHVVVPGELLRNIEIPIQGSHTPIVQTGPKKRVNNTYS